MIAQLKMAQPQQFVAGFERPNLRLAIQEVDKEFEKLEKLERLIASNRTGSYQIVTFGLRP